MSLRDVHGGRALVLRLILAELVARRGTGPLALRVVPRAQIPRSPSQRSSEQAGLRSELSEEPA